MNKASFYMAVGLPGSGKSYLFESVIKKLSPDCVYVSSDAIREEVFGDVNDQEHNEQVFELMKRRTLDSLKAGVSVYYDATNVSAKRRIGFLKGLSHIKDIARVCVLNTPPVEVVKFRNAHRERKVPEYVIDRMLKSFNVPDYSEGWDVILRYGSDEDHNAIEEITCSSAKLSHDNPHHSATVGVHMFNAANYAEKELKASWEVIEAACYHDIGKPICKVFQDAKGEPSDVAHYYNHENVGAYLYLSHAKNDGVSLYIANLIAHHMDFFKGEKYIEKIHNRFGEGFFRDLQLLHEADVNAH